MDTSESEEAQADPDGAAGGQAGQEPGDGEEEAPRPPVHYSTGRLTRAQAAAVDRWRARLREDRPLPGQDRVSAVARMLGSSDHPRASTSDAVAAAIADMLARPPEPLEVVGYAYAAIRQQWLAGQGRGDASRAPVHPPVSYYLPAALADQADQLVRDAAGAAWDKLLEITKEAARLHPGDEPEQAELRAVYISEELDHYRLYYVGQRKGTRLRSVPAGALARMAIDRWAQRDTDWVIGNAVSWCQGEHDQWHRAWATMQKLAR